MDDCSLCYRRIRNVEGLGIEYRLGRYRDSTESQPLFPALCLFVPFNFFLGSCKSVRLVNIGLLHSGRRPCQVGVGEELWY
jgi:hypothetical protein